MEQRNEINLSDWLTAEIVLVDATGTIIQANRKWYLTAQAGGLATRVEHWNYIDECEAAVRRGCEEAVPVLEGLRRVLAGELPSTTITYVSPFNGRHHWYEVAISVAEFDCERHAILMHVDVSAMQVDSVTRLPNRAAFDAQLALAVSLAQEQSCHTGMALVDLNQMKSINDTYGHYVGDAALKALATELRARAGPDCVVARVGGDEFGVVLPVYCDQMTVRRILARLSSGVAASITFDDHLIPISASVGLALYPDDGETPETLYQSADRSMYAQKRGISQLPSR